MASLPSELGPYHIESLLGSGGMGEVYRARDTRLHRTVAIKVLPAHLSNEPAQRERLLREARSVAALQHPNICQLHDISAHDGVDFLVMEYVEGETLAARLGREPLPVDQVLRYGIQIADAVSYAHERGILHRDLKALNVMITPEGRVKVLDFGLAQPLERALVDDATRSQASLEAGGQIAGTLAYMPPEVLRGDPADARSELWSLGVMLFEMASGELPFRGRTGFDLTSAILQGTPAPLPPRVPASLRSVILRCLAKEPGQRYRQAGEVRAALEAIQDTGSMPVTPPVPVAAPRRRRRALLVAVAAVLALLAAVVASWLLRSPRAPQPANQRLVSSFSGSHRQPAFSPDGSMIAFINADANGVPQVWVKNLAEGDPIAITSGDVPASRPRWSPKNDRIVFARRGQGIWSAPPLGGPARRILQDGRNPNFSRDGQRLVFEKGNEIWIAGADGSQPHKLDGLPEKFYSVDSHPSFSPDGRRIAFFLAERGPNGDIRVVSSDGGQARRLTSDMRLGGMPVWTPDGRWIIFSSARGGSLTLWRIPADGGQPESITTGAGEDSEPEISADGTKLIYTNVRNNWGLVLLNPVTGQQQELLERRDALLWPRFSPSGDSIAFFHPIGGGAQVFTIGADGKNLRQITQDKGGMSIMPCWSADGAFLYFYQGMGPKSSLRKVPASGGGSIEIAPWGWETHTGAEVSPDGRDVVYTLQEANRPKGTVVRNLNTGQERSLGLILFSMRWSPDGKFVLGEHKDAVMTCPVAGGDCTVVTKGFHPVLSADGSRLYFFRPGDSRDSPVLWVAGRDGRNEKKVAVLSRMRMIDVHFDVSPQDQVVWAPFREGRHELWMADLR